MDRAANHVDRAYEADFLAKTADFGLLEGVFTNFYVSIATFYEKFSKIFLQIAWGMKLLDTRHFAP